MHKIGQPAVRKKINEVLVHIKDSKVRSKDMNMRKTAFGMLLAFAALAVSACAPLVVGGAVAVVADEVIEQENGGDGLF